MQSHTDKCTKTRFDGTPGPFRPLTSDEFYSAVQNKAGAHQTALKSLVGLPINTKAQSTYVDPSGHNPKKLEGAPHETSGTFYRSGKESKHTSTRGSGIEQGWCSNRFLPLLRPPLVPRQNPVVR